MKCFFFGFAVLDIKKELARRFPCIMILEADPIAIVEIHMYNSTIINSNCIFY